MTTPNHLAPATHLNHLRRNVYYRAITDYGIIAGQYLGMEAPYGDRAVLLRDDSGSTNSVPIANLLAITKTEEVARAA